MASTKRLKAKQKGNKIISKPQKSSSRLSQLFFGALSIFFIFIGAIFVFLASTNSLDLDWKHPFLTKAPAKTQAPVAKIKPTQLYIPKLTRILPVNEGIAVNNRWLISQTGVSFYSASALPGQKGNSVIYGHNRNDILGDLPQLKIGDPIYVVLSSGQFVRYQVSETKEVTPQTVEILDQTNDSRLTVYTCSGFLDSARFVVIAKQTSSI